ncbi:acetyltransferase [Aspergillus sclerotialis]|uniref:Acetyltransferase n=1 Tax=Aspergillus sclerotialis TaxID=2070753 RepID=A0A3A2ZKA6_9EURO|nr:acetyltransferase [Aspergillus sclerotialis]
MAIIIEPAQFPKDADAVHNLFTLYAKSLGVDLTYQNFQEELDSLPGKYSESQGGALLIARSDTPTSNNDSTPKAIGCVALRRNTSTWCEMKRLYVVAGARGTRLGEKLVEAILVRAKELGYRGIRLDTLADMRAAQQLYRKYGFVEIEGYYDTPVEGTIFMGCEFGATTTQ